MGVVLVAPKNVATYTEEEETLQEKSWCIDSSCLPDESASQTCDERAAVARRRARCDGDDTVRRAERAAMFGHMGEVSSARQALKGAVLAPGTQATLQELTDARKWPP